MGCELSKGREKELNGKGCNQIDLAIQVDLFISIHPWILPFFLKPFAGAATQRGYPADIAASAHPVRPGTTSGDGSAAAQVQDADAGKSAGALN